MAMPMRIVGMASGMDIDAIVRDLMKAERIPVDKLLQKKQTLQWKIEGYNSVNLKFSAFRDSVFSARFSGSWHKLDADGNTVPLSEDEIVEKVKDIVGKYNDLVSTLNGKLSEEVYRDYAPLTSEQKSAMNETDIANWESRAKSGLFRNDDILRRAVGDLRGLASAKVNGVSDPNYDTLTEIGIKTTTYLKGSPDNGKLVIDETKLRAAIRANPDAVIELFTAQSTTTDSKGIFQRAFEIADSAMLNISRKISGGVSTAESILSQIGKIDVKVKEWNDRLNKKEDRYYQMFTVMEKAIANSNAQMAWLAQQMG